MAEQLRDVVRGLMGRARDDLARLVSIPSVADPRIFPPERCLEAAEWVRDAIADAGLEDCRLLDPPDGHPAVFGRAPGPEGAPTVLLYSHYDVQPPLDEDAWQSPPFELAERDGRWYGRGAADCKGNVVVHLTALRALAGEIGVGVKFICEGAEEQGTGGMEELVARDTELLRADAVIVADTGNFEVGAPSITTSLRGIANVVVRVRTLEGPVHSGMFGGPAPDALVALTRMLATLHDENGDVAVAGLGDPLPWEGIEYPPQAYRADAGLLDGVELIGDAPIAEMLWARPSVNVLGIDCPPIAGSTPSLNANAAALVSMRIPPGIDPAVAAEALAAHLRTAAPWGVRVEIETKETAEPVRAPTAGPAHRRMAEALSAAFGGETVALGEGGSIPLCTALANSMPDAEILMIGVEEPRCLIHAPNESVDPSEIEHIALAEAEFLRGYGAGLGGGGSAGG